MSLSQGENVSIGICATALNRGHWVMCLGLREFGKNLVIWEKEAVLIELSVAVLSTREVKPILASCLISKDSGLPRGAGKAREGRHTKGKCYLGTSFPSPDSLKSFWQRREKKINEDLHLREAKGLWPPAWKRNVLIAPIKMQGGCGHSGVRDKETVPNGRSFIFTTLKWKEPRPGEFREARELLAHLNYPVTYFIVHRSMPTVTGQLGAAPDVGTAPEMLKSINGRPSS